MTRSRTGRLALAIALGLVPTAGRGEDLNDAWNQAIRVNAAVQARQLDRFSAGMTAGAARSARLPSVNVMALDSFLNQSPTTRVPASFASAASGGSSAAATRLAFPILGPNQSNVPFVLGNVSQPLYQGGRLRANIDAADAGVRYQKTEESRTVLDLKLIVAEAYVGVLRSSKNLDVSRSNVEQLAAFLRDVTNRKNEGRATRNEELAAEVSLSNARLQGIDNQKNLDVAWATYNRYLCRPPTATVDLAELAGPPPSSPVDAGMLLEHKIDEPLAEDLMTRALRRRPELQGLGERSRQADSQAKSTMATLKPQFAFNASYVDIGAQNFTNPNIFAGTFQLSWTIFDGGQTRKRAEAQRLQARSLQKQRADASADIALQVRSRLLDLEASRQRVVVSGASVASAEENIKVVTERYRQGLSIYTEVLDAESRRIQSLNGYFAAAYDNALAFFRLRRAVGDL